MNNTVWKHLGAIDPPRQGLSYIAVHDLISEINYINSTKQANRTNKHRSPLYSINVNILIKIFIYDILGLI